MKSLFAKILLAQVLAVVLALGVLAVLARASLERGFFDFLERQESEVLSNLAPALGEWYENRGGWDQLRGQPEHWDRILRRTRPGRPGLDGPHRRARPPGGEAPMMDPDGSDQSLRWLRSFDRLHLRQRLFLLDAERGYLAGPRFDGAGQLPLVAVTAAGATVGWVGFVPVREGLPPEAQRFLRGQLQVLLVSLGIALALAAGLAYLLARHLSRPVLGLDRAVGELSRGHYAGRVTVGGRDEIGRLGDNVNRLAATLEHNRSARRRWMADIAHELRTPVAILKGEIEALADGVRKPEPKAFASLAEEIEQLSVLVNDLQSLALADAGALNLQQQPLDLAAVLGQACDTFHDRLAARGIGLELEAPGALQVDADPQRLRQLLHNLLDNAARYVETGGRVRIVLEQAAGGARIVVEDSGPGVSGEQRARLFDRFYRVEEGRSRSSGGSGLGLAICRSIVEAHGGSIRAEPSALGGLAIEVELPGGERRD